MKSPAITAEPTHGYEDDQNVGSVCLSGIRDSPHLHHITGASPRPLALRDIPDEIRQSISSLYSAPGLTAAETEAQSPGHDIHGVQENARSWTMLLIALIFQSLYGIAIFAPPVYFVAYMEVFQLNKSDGAWVSSIYVFCCFVIGIIASPCVTMYGCRNTALVGASIMVVSLALSSLSPNIVMIYILQSCIAGFGAGTTFIGVNVILPKYFSRHRALASSLALTGLGVGLLVAPVTINYLIEEYGWRGAVLIEAAIVAHKIPLALTFVDPTVRKSNKSKSAIYKPSQSEASESKVDEVHKVVEGKTDQLRLKAEDNDLISQKEYSGKKKAGQIVTILRSAFDFSMLRDPVFVMYCMSNLLTRVNTSLVITHLPSYCVTQGLSLEQASLIMSISGGCNVASRFLAGMLSLHSRMNHLVVYGVVMISNAVSSLLLLYLPSFTGKSVAAALFGFAFGFDYPFVPVILVQMMGLELLPRSLAIYNLVSLATVILAVPPFTGFLYDVSGSYYLPFYIGAATCTAGSVVSFVVAHFIKRRIQAQAITGTTNI